MFKKQVKCITCQKKIDKKQARKKFDLYFCSTECEQKYQEHLNNIDQDFTLDNCC